MGTACWGTNDTFDCAWITFGYGSRNDTSKLWLGLEAYKALSRLDDLKMGAYTGEMTYEEFQKSSIMRKYLFSSDFIKHPNGEETSLKWFEEALNSRAYYVDHPEKEEEKQKDLIIRDRVYYFQDLTQTYSPFMSLLNSNLAQDFRFEEWTPMLEPGYEPSWDGQLSDYESVNKVRDTEDYQNRNILMGGLRHHKVPLNKCHQMPIDWLGEGYEKYIFVDGNYHIPYDKNMNYRENLKATEWEKLNNWKGN
jgi:hypothetical protein